jgi:hypothetical protein
MDLDEVKREIKKKTQDFAEKVAPLYRELRWEWDIGGRLYIPSKEQIEEKLIKLIDGLLPEDRSYSSGGLEVYFEPPGEEDGGSYGLRFTIEDELIHLG